LTFHRKLQRWLQLGGHSDENEWNPATTAHREACEESGLDTLDFHPRFGCAPLDIDVHLIPDNPKEAAHHHLDFRYVFYAPRPEAIVCGDESTDLRWFSIPETIVLGFESALYRALDKIEQVLAHDGSGAIQ
jgi:8-oxo-dGTP pyrophosphatase MutT (NUDIX family)